MRRKKPFRFLWITDPWETLDHPRDTTLRLAEESLRAGCESSWCESRSIRWEDGRVIFDARRIISVGEGRKADSFRLGPKVPCSQKDFDSLHYRTDPPVDLTYLHPLQLLALESKPGKSALVNPLSVLLSANEKLEASRLGALMPPSIASSLPGPLEEFGRRHGLTVLKPLHEAQSHGIELLDWKNAASVATSLAKVRSASQDFSRPVLLQKYLEGIREGELRLWFLDGKLLACVRKLPLAGDFRVDMDRGSRLAAATPGRADKKAALKIGRHLRKRGIRLAAVDLIDGYITDFNFTSPGLIVQMEELLGRNLARSIIKKLRRKKA